MIDIPEGMFRSKTVRIRILDFSGKYIYADENFDLAGYPVSFNLDFIDDGIYILNITDNDISHWIKILKIK
jgi:FKBP-type peptidyl-prolyl cis-trans isomerase 2